MVGGSQLSRAGLSSRALGKDVGSGGCKALVERSAVKEGGFKELRCKGSPKPVEWRRWNARAFEWKQNEILQPVGSCKGLRCSGEESNDNGR